jgi:hypothetical protein
MKLISHRGNLKGPNPDRENTIDYIQEALDLGYDVEIDVWISGASIYLGHDSPETKIHLAWLLERGDKLWIHCKNISAMVYLKEYGDLNVFWHENDKVTLTSKSFIWAFPGMQPISKSIAVLPEMYEEKVDSCCGVCSDYIVNYS